MSDKDRSDKLKLWGIIITVLGAIIVALIQFHPDWNRKNVSQRSIQYTISGTIVDETTNQSVPEAEITVVGRNEKYTSESDGNFNITIKDSVGTVRIRFTKKGYQSYDNSFDLPSDRNIVQLTHIKSN